MLRRAIRKVKSDLGLYRGFESANRRARAEGRKEVEDDDPVEKAPPGPIVLLVNDGDAYAVLIDPPLPSGDHRQTFLTKDDAWAGAQALWTVAKIGFSDRTTFTSDQQHR